jgi:8-oxo-dGTP diphosphatase
VAGHPPVPVVCALIERDGRVLLARRPAHKPLALKWEFPGGKVEAGETAEAALLREIKEELGCRVAIVRPLPRFTHTYERITIEMIPFVCRLAASSPEPQPTEHTAVVWVPPQQLREYELAAADWPVVEAWLKAEPD